MKTEYNKVCEILKHRSYVVKYKNKDYTIVNLMGLWKY